jgi:uncharacterized protein
MDDLIRLKAEAAAFRGLVHHLQKRQDVQNIALMNLAGFCRNCLSKWYKVAAEHYGTTIPIEDAHQAVYGMSFADWKAKHQTPATPAQEKGYEAGRGGHAKITVVEP